MRNYSSTAVATTLASAITSSDTSMTLSVATGLPSVPFTLVIEPDTVYEEIVTVTARSGTSISAMSRGQESTTARSHASASVVKHMVTGRDLQDAQDHIENTTTAHGVTGAVVGTTNSQTLTNKSISGSANTITNIAQASVTNLVTDLSNKAPAASPTFTGTVVLPSTTSIGTVSSTEIGYVDGVTSAIQTQLDAKAPLASPTFTGTVVLPSTTSIGTISNTELLKLDGLTATTAELNKLAGATASTAELNRVTGVTSSIQTQLDAKLASVYASVYKTTGSLSTDGTIAYANENADTNGFHSTSADTSRITIPTGYAGYYRISASVNAGYSGNDGGYKIYFTKNGTKITGTDGGGYVSSVFLQDSSFIETIVSLAVADYIEVYLDTITGPGLSITSTFNVQYLGA
jgi:hypothetical protein